MGMRGTKRERERERERLRARERKKKENKQEKHPFDDSPNACATLAFHSCCACVSMRWFRAASWQDLSLDPLQSAEMMPRLPSDASAAKVSACGRI